MFLFCFDLFVYLFLLVCFCLIFPIYFKNKFSIISGWLTDRSCKSKDSLLASCSRMPSTSGSSEYLIKPNHHTLVMTNDQFEIYNKKTVRFVDFIGKKYTSGTVYLNVLVLANTGMFKHFWC